MKPVTVNKDQLIAKLQENRAEHTAKVTRSREVYRQRIVEELDKRLEEAKRGGDIDPGFLHLLPIPRDFTTEYDRAIDMLSWEIETEVEISAEDFNRFVRDEWEWRQQFTASNAMYLAQ